MTDQMFPMGVTPVELAMMLEDCPSHPMEFLLRLNLTGRPDRAALEQSVRTTLARHPLLTAVIRQSGKRRWEWVQPGDPPPVITWHSASPPQRPRDAPIDIRHRPGLRVTVVEEGDRSELSLQFHHAACDGLSGSDCASDLLTAYANHLRGDSSFRFKRLDPARLRDRSRLPVTVWQLGQWLASHALELPRFRRFYKRRPVSVAVPESRVDLSAPRNGIECIFHTFSRDDSVMIHRQARQAGATVNCVIVRDLFATLGQWRRGEGRAQDGDVLRVTMPVSMRTAADRTMPAANGISLVCLDRTIRESNESTPLLQGIDAEFETYRKKNRGLIFLLALRLMRHAPIRLEQALRRKRFSGTALVSNIGPALANCHLPRQDGKLVAGDLTLDRVEFLPVLRPRQDVSFGVTTYAGQLTLGLHYDSRWITPETAGGLLECLTTKLATSSGNPHNTSPTRQRGKSASDPKPELNAKQIRPDHQPDAPAREIGG